MKTDVSIRNLESDKSDSKLSNENRVVVRGTRRTLQSLQTAAGDKENLVGAGRLGMQMTPVKDVTVIIPETRGSKKLRIKPVDKKPVITAEDLTSEAGPSESYWEVLAERRRLTLEAALEENEALHEKIKLLEEENAHCKQMLEETRALVETLTEVLNEGPENSEESLQSEE